MLAAALVAEDAVAGEVVPADLVRVVLSGGLELASPELAVLRLGLNDGALVLAAAVVTEHAAAAMEVAAYLVGVDDDTACLVGRMAGETAISIIMDGATAVAMLAGAVVEEVEAFFARQGRRRIWWDGEAA